MIRALGYCRVSSEEQKEKGHSLGAQERAIQALCAAKEWELIETITDGGYSGTTLERPGLQRVLGMGRAHEADVVVITDLDRLSRSPRHIYDLLEDHFAANGLRLVSINQGWDTTTPMGQAMLGVAAVFAKLERDVLVERTKAGMHEARRKGIHCGRRCEADPEELARARELRTGGMTYRAIAATLNWPVGTTVARLKAE